MGWTLGDGGMGHSIKKRAHASDKQTDTCAHYSSPFVSYIADDTPPKIMHIIKEFMPEVYTWIEKNLDNAVEKGWLF